MKVAILHSADAAEPPEDPVLSHVEEAVRRAGHETFRVAVGPTLEPVIARLRAGAPELVFNLAESFGGKSALESNVAALLNLLDLRYTGSSPAGLMLAGDKTLAKKMLAFHGIRSPEFATVFRGTVDWAGEIDFPLIVKPTLEDASIGITRRSIVRDVKELLEVAGALEAESRAPVLVEQFIEGRELYVGVLGNADARALPIMEMDFSRLPPDQPRIASWEAKWGEDGEARGTAYETTRSVFPVDVSADLLERVQRLAVDAFQVLRLRDYARADMRVTSAGEVYVLEVNPNCYLERGAEFAQAAGRAGLSYEALVARILELALARYNR